MGPELDDGRVPAEFVGLVRDALAHLYDPVHLLGHPLARLLTPVLPLAGSAAQSLRVYLLDAIECLAPAGRAREKDQRPYSVLVERYVGGRSIDDIAASMHLGARQVRREHEEGVLALATHLWSLCHGSWQVSVPDVRDDARSSLEAELAALGVELVSLPLADLVASVLSAARALAAGYGTALSADSAVGVHGPSGSHACGKDSCLCDRTLARQALLASVSAQACRRPQYVHMSVATSGSRAGLEITASPPVKLTGDEQAQQELAKARAFMAVQGGNLRLVETETGLCPGVRLLFQRDSHARVMVVDDNETMLQLYTRYLSLGSYAVSVAASAAEAEAILAQEPPGGGCPVDAIVLDVMMRGTDGWELLEKLRARPQLAHVPIIVCSVLDEPKLASLLGAQACLKKPVVAEDLLQALHRVLSGEPA